MTGKHDPEERRAEILDAAMRCYVKGGYHRTSMDDIVKESGLSKGTLYWYFKDKQTLFMALFQRVMAQIGASAAPMDDSLPAAERLRLLLTSSLQGTEQHLQTLRVPIGFVFELWQNAAFHDYYKSLIGGFAAQVRTLVQDGIASGEFRPVDAHEFAWAVMGIYEGLLLHYSIGMPGDTSKKISILTDLIIDGLRHV